MELLTSRGGGSVPVLATAADRASLGGRPAVVVADGVVEANGWIDPLVSSLGLAGDPVVHAVAPGEPTTTSVESAAEVIRDRPAAVVVAIGGGSTLDTAKLASCVAAGPGGVEQYALAARALPTGPLLVAVPTTSGTGSEVTRTCVLTTVDGRKVWAWGDQLLPRFVVLEPTLTSTMPVWLTAATGLDAMVHAVEAATGRRVSDVVVDAATAAIGLVVEHLPGAITAPADLDRRRGMQQAAMLAGVAIDTGGTGIAHAIGHGLGTLAHVPHGVAVAVGLSAALAWNVETAGAAYGPVADTMGCAPSEVPARFDELIVASRLGDAVAAIGPLDVDVDDVATAMVAAENRPMHDNNCRLADAADRRSLAEATLARWSTLLAS